MQVFRVANEGGVSNFNRLSFLSQIATHWYCFCLWQSYEKQDTIRQTNKPMQKSHQNSLLKKPRKYHQNGGIFQPAMFSLLDIIL